MSAPATPAPAEPRRLYLDGKKGYVGGVCAGLANHYGLDVRGLRIAFVLLTLLTFFVGLVVYVILWLVIPVRPYAEPAAPDAGPAPQQS